MTVPNSREVIQRDLWGGAVTCVVPASMLDVRGMAPVPDHQEVYLDAEADQALIFEIVEHDSAVQDEECGRHLFEDAAQGNEATSYSLEQVSSLGTTEVPNVPEAAYTCLARGRQMVRRGRESRDTDVLLAVLRFPHVQSDIVISLSTPAATGSTNLSEAAGVMAQALASLRIVEWDLFGDGNT